MKVKLTLEYAGEEFSGWQRQEGMQTVQGSLEHALRMIFQGDFKKLGKDFTENIIVTGSGRTDSGVSAKGQVASFVWPEELEFRSWRMESSLNALTPAGMAVLKAEAAPDDFDARFTPHIKSYQYRLLLRKARPAYDARRVWLVRSDLDVESMIRAARDFTGQHDFESFRARDCSGKTTVRTIVYSELARVSHEELVFTVHGKGFLKQMIRIMVGTLIEIGTRRKPHTFVRELIQSRDRSKAGRTAPPDGLTLQWIRYFPEAEYLLNAPWPVSIPVPSTPLSDT